MAIAALSGLALSAAFPPARLWPLSLVAIAPLVWLARDARPRRGFLLGTVFGFAFFGATLYWIALFGELAWFSLTLVCALWVAVYAALLPLVWRFRRPWWSAVVAAALWVVLVEWLRGAFPLGGFTWGSLAAPQTGGPLLPAASVVGAWGIAFAVVLVNGLVVGGIEALRRGGRASRAGFAVVAIALLLALSSVLPAPTTDGAPIDVAAIQVDVRSAADANAVEEDRAIARLHAELHRTLAEDPPELIVWGESSLDPGANHDATLAEVRDAIAEVGAPTLVSSTQIGSSGGLERQANLLDGAGRQVDSYAKVHLVPFGEFVPFRGSLDWISALRQIPYDLTPGTSVHALRGAGLPPIGASVCFENSFESIQRALVDDGARLLVVTTNNASYEDTAASAQHVQFSRLRAVETGRPVVHAAISGIGAIIGPDGSVAGETELFEPDVLRATVRTSGSRTAYVRFGFAFPWLCLILVAVGIALPRRRRRDHGAPPSLGERPRTLVLLPTYEERATIGTVLEELLSLPERVDVLVIDDSSPDGTGEVVRSRAADEPRLRLSQRARKSGLASAYLAGFRTALQEGYDLVVEMDSDLSHQPEELHGLLSTARLHDLVIGSRYVPGGSVTNWSRVRVALSKMGNLYARLALGLPVRDATSGFRVYRRGLLAELLERPITSDGYGFQIELALRSWALGASIGETPISFREREHGQSKISRRIVVEALWLVTVWGLRSRLRGDPLLADRPSRAVASEPGS